MSEAEAAAAGGFVFKTTEDGFVVGDRRFADRAEAEEYSTEKKTQLAQHQKEAKARRAARTKEYSDNRAAGKRRAAARGTGHHNPGRGHRGGYPAAE